jgi:hypothetical protein
MTKFAIENDGTIRMNSWGSYPLRNIPNYYLDNCFVGTLVPMARLGLVVWALFPPFIMFPFLRQSRMHSLTQVGGEPWNWSW